MWISMEFCEIGSCLDLLRIIQDPFAEVVVQSITRDVLFGLEFLHAQKIVHRDLKAGNVLLTAKGRARLTDFGVSGLMESAKRMTIIGSPYWMAPEVIREVGYAFPADIWGLGITVIEMLEMLPPRAALHPMKVLLQIPALPPPKLEEPNSFSESLVSFLSMCLVKIPDARSTAIQLQEHKFIAEKKSQPLKVADLIGRGLELISKYGGRDQAMKNRDEDDAEHQTEEAPKERRQRKKVLRKNANATIRLVSEGSNVSASEVAPQPKRKYPPEQASVMKRLTRILRSVKAIRARVEKGQESTELLLAELAECGRAISAIDDPVLHVDPCAKNLRKLAAELKRVMGMCQPPKASTDSPRVSAKKKVRSKSAAPKSSKEAQVAQFRKLLEELNLEDYTAGLLALGVERVGDLKFATDGDLDGLGMKQIEKKKLMSIKLTAAPAVVAGTKDSPRPVGKKKKKKRPMTPKASDDSPVLLHKPPADHLIGRRNSHGATSPVAPRQAPSRPAPPPPIVQSAEKMSPVPTRSPPALPAARVGITRRSSQPNIGSSNGSETRKQDIDTLKRDTEVLAARLAKVRHEQGKLELQKRNSMTK